MKKFIVTLVAVLAIAGITVGLCASTTAPATGLSNVTVTAYRGSNPLVSMSGADCASVFYVLPGDIKARITQEWDKFYRVSREQGTYAGVKYSFRKDLTLEYKGYKVIATNVTPELIVRVLSTVE